MLQTRVKACLGFVAPALVGSVLTALLLAPMAGAQGTVTLTTSIFGQGERTDATENFTKQLGNSTRLGYRYQGGPHFLSTAYTTELRQGLDSGHETDASWRGESRYKFSPSHQRFDFNVGHGVRAIADEESFFVDPTAYSLRHTLSAGGGLNANPTDRTQLRLQAQTSQMLDGNLSPEGRSATLSSNLGVRHSPVSSTNVSLSRNKQWDDEGQYRNTIDSAELNYSRALYQGRLSASLGISEFYADDTSRTAITGSLTRAWVTDMRQVTLEYSRSFSTTLRDLELQVMAVPVDPESDDAEVQTETVVIQLESAVLRDALTLTGQTDYLCTRCQLQGNVSLATPEDVYTGERTFSYTLGTEFRLQHSSIQSTRYGYQWHAQSDDFATRLRKQQNRVNAVLERQLSDRSAVEASVEHSWRRGHDHYRTFIRLGINFDVWNHHI